MSRRSCSFGNLSKLKRLHRAGRPWDETTCYEGSDQRISECLRYAYENGCFLTSAEELSVVDEEDRLGGILQYSPVATAAAGGHLQTLRYLIEETNCAMGGLPIRSAAINGRIDTLSYLIDRGFTDDSDDPTLSFVNDGGVCDAVVSEELFAEVHLHSVKEPGQDYVACLQLLRSKGYNGTRASFCYDHLKACRVGVFNETQLYLMGDHEESDHIVEHHRIQGAECLLEKLRAADEAMCTTYDETAWKSATHGHHETRRQTRAWQRTRQRVFDTVQYTKIRVHVQRHVIYELFHLELDASEIIRGRPFREPLPYPLPNFYSYATDGVDECSLKF